MVNKSADDVDTMMDNQPIVRPEQGQEMCEHTTRPQPVAPAPWPQIPKPCPQLQTLVTHQRSGLELLGLVTLQKRCPEAPALREAEAAEITLNVNVDNHILG